ncbi:MAG TPA: APC family permease [Pyrinomonadaceae bacterium]|nr:APC family permease [Pyrinomonadaceae bacterium]
MQDPPSSSQLASLEQEVERRSAVFKKELGLFDLVLTQIVFVVGTIWVGAAAKLGHSQLIMWSLAILTFYIPLAAVVIYLNSRMPLEGGLYQWARLAFNDFVAFMVAWNLWIFGILVLSGIGLIVTTNLSYALGPAADWMRGSKWFITFMSCLLVAAITVASLRGLALGKWVHNAGGLMLLATFITLILLPFFSLARGDLHEYHPFAVAMPAMTAFNVNIFSKLALGALTGFEYVAIVAGECRAPARNITRSVIIAAPIIALMFILGTSAVLAYVKPEDVDLIGPIPQVLTRGFGSFGWVGKIISIAIIGVVMRQIALMSIYFTGNTRLPMVAGWDSLLPSWFSRLHQRYKTPVNSILFVGAFTLGFGLASLIGVGHQEAFQLVDNAATVFYASTYVVLFAIPLAGMKKFDIAAPAWLKVACASGLLVSLLAIALTIVPIIEVQSRLSFALKITAVVIVANSIGALVFILGQRRTTTGRRQSAA